MEKQNFEYQTLDEALAAGGKNRVLVTNPEGIGPETKRVMQEVYDRRAQFGDNVVDFKYQPVGGFETRISRLQKAALRKAEDIVMREGLEDAASLGDVYVYSAVKEAQFRAYENTMPREFLQTKDLNEFRREWAEASNCSEDIDLGIYAKEVRKELEKPQPCAFEWASIKVLGDKMVDYIAEAVRKDIGLTEEETEKLKAKCDKVIRRSKGLAARAWAFLMGE